MADKPIIFSAPMIRALLDGRKTQTRRVLPDQGLLHNGPSGPEIWTGFLGWQPLAWALENRGACGKGVLPPYAIGDRLWVREAWFPLEFKTGDGESVVYKAEQDDDGTVPYLVSGTPLGGGVGNMRVERWHSPIHMPRWASRLTLIVTDVRVQRLQDISEADAIAEGGDAVQARMYPELGACRDWVADLWNSIHGPDAWDANPWVVALTFDVVQSNIDQVHHDKAA